MRRKVKSNPEWTDEILLDFCDPILRAARKHNLPEPLLNDKCRIETKSELGEGTYGVVWTTDAADCVFKLSTDSTECHFIQTAINLRKNEGVDPPGIVDYRAVFELPTERDGDPVFAIWREQAFSVGLPCEIKKSDTEMIEFVNLMQAFYKSADTAYWLAYAEQDEYDNDGEYFDWIDERVALANEIIDGGKPAHKSNFSILLAHCYKTAIKIEESGETGRYIGNALRTYFENGILLCDIHGNNVGEVSRGKCRPLNVITDPGHAMVCRRDLADVKIPMLKE